MTERRCREPGRNLFRRISGGLRSSEKCAGRRLLVIAILATAACTPEGPARGNGESTAAKLQPSAVPAIEFDLERIGGGRVSLEQYRGRLVLLDFWATWCPPCVTEIPELNALHASQRERGVDVLAISVDDLEADEIAAWVEENGVHYPVALGNEELARKYGAHAYPFHVLIGANGMVLEVLEPGFHDEQELIAILDTHRSG